MANTYSQLYVHYVFAVQNRLCHINNKWQDKLYKYMSGIIDKQGHRLYVINGMSVNFLWETRSMVIRCAIDINDLRANESNFITTLNTNKIIPAYQNIL